LVQYLRAHDWRNVEELADSLRQDWHISKRFIGSTDGPLPVLDDVFSDFLTTYERTHNLVNPWFDYAPVEVRIFQPHCDTHKGFEYDCIDCGDALVAIRSNTT
jgi:hypothetical protein